MSQEAYQEAHQLFIQFHHSNQQIQLQNQHKLLRPQPGSHQKAHQEAHQLFQQTKLYHSTEQKLHQNQHNLLRLQVKHQ